MKKSIVIVIASVLIVCILAFLLIPTYDGMYLDGGTRVYRAPAYTLVIWNRMLVGGEGIYHNTSVFWYPDSQKSIDDLWLLEVERNS